LKRAPLIVELSEVQQELIGVNRQYDQLGECLGNQQKDLQSMLDSVTEFHNDYQAILRWLHSMEQIANERSVNPDKAIAADQVRSIFRWYIRWKVLHAYGPT